MVEQGSGRVGEEVQGRGVRVGREGKREDKE